MVADLRFEGEIEIYIERKYSPLHDNQQTLSSLIQVLVDVNDSHNVGTRRGPPVELYLPAGLGAVLQHLGEKKTQGEELRKVWGITNKCR